VKRDKGKISVVINTYNALQHLKEVIEAVKGFDEVLVCDMESTDGTPDIARSEGCRVVTFPRGEHAIVEPAREFAIHEASCEWVLVVDADEVVTPQLHDYLYRRISEDDCPDGLFIPRHNRFMGRYTRAFTADHQLRFFRRDATHWPAVIHAAPQVEGRVEKIAKNQQDIKLIHLANETIGELLEKCDRYTNYDVAKKQHKHYGAMALLFRPLWKFVSFYVLQGNYRDGLRGLWG
jgi:glycosyltransferase involved in cell wall biosynthesis